MTPARPRPVACAVVGASGYSGAELVGLLSGHPRASIVGLFGSQSRGEGDAAVAFSTLCPRYRGVCDMPVRASSLEAILATRPDAVFLATPIGASHALAPALADAGVVVLDLSAAFRLKDAALYESRYALEHRHPSWLARAVYGLCEVARDQIAGASLIAVPGCYPTSAILALAPLVRAGAIEPGRVPIIDAVSGVSGAGRHAQAHTSFCEVSLTPYAVLAHRHQPEIDAHAGVRTLFTPHLGPFDRGILSTIHVDLAAGWDGRRVSEVYERAYADERFVRALSLGTWPSVAGVRGTNFCDLGWVVEESLRHLVVVSAIDNLVKGAAGQALQCMNIRFGIDEGAGLGPTRGLAAGAGP